jgi:hypothetical protein
MAAKILIGGLRSERRDLPCLMCLHCGGHALFLAQVTRCNNATFWGNALIDPGFLGQNTTKGWTCDLSLLMIVQACPCDSRLFLEMAGAVFAAGHAANGPGNGNFRSPTYFAFLNPQPGPNASRAMETSSAAARSTKVRSADADGGQVRQPANPNNGGRRGDRH